MSSASDTGNSYGIYNVETGSIIVGEKDGHIDKEIIIIEAEYALSNSTGKLYWYDGSFRYTTQLLVGSVMQIEDNAQIVENAGEGYLEMVEPVEWIQNVTTGKSYTNLQIAIDESYAKDTLQVIQDYIQYGGGNIAEGKHVVIDLNGKTVTIYGSLYNQGALEIEDSVGNGNIHSPVGTVIIQNIGTLEVRRRNCF